MGQFLDMPLIYEHNKGTDLVTIHKRFSYNYTKECLIVVPKGFICDGASIPKWAWIVVGHPFAEYVEAAVVHDWLYETKPCSKHFADKVFLQAMKDLKVNITKRRIMYWAVCAKWWW